MLPPARENGAQIRAEAFVARFCAGMGYHFRRGRRNCSRLRRKMPPNPPGMENSSRLRENWPPNPPGMKKCSRLRWKTVPNPPGSISGTFLRGNWVSFSAQYIRVLHRIGFFAYICSGIAAFCSLVINILLGGAIRLRLYPLNLMRLVPPEGKRGRRPTSLVY